MITMSISLGTPGFYFMLRRAQSVRGSCPRANRKRAQNSVSNRSSFAHTSGTDLSPVLRSSTICRNSFFDWFKEKLQDNDKFTEVDIDEERGLVSEERVGPQVLFLIGFQEQDVPVVQKMLFDLEASFVPILQCTDTMLDLTLEQALSETQENPAQVAPAKDLPRCVMMSGMSGGEVVMIMDEFQLTGLPRPAFAAAVPRNMCKKVSELVTEIDGDHKSVLAEEAQALAR